jgi:GTP-binding protein Era
MESKDNTSITKQHCATVALIGAPNAGKSTLLNNLVGFKVSIVSPKVQTTRNVINGIYTEGDAQLIFIDTPGIFTPSPKKKLEQAIVKEAWNGLKDADMIMLLIDSNRGICYDTQTIIDFLITKKLRAILVLNKIDLVNKKDLNKLENELSALGIFDHMFRISALNSDGTTELKDFLLSNAPASPWIYNEDDITNVPLRFITAELTREQLFLKLHQEIPYNTTVEVEKWEELENGEVKIYQVIYVTKESQKIIVIGKSGQMIKEIGQNARKEIEALLGRTAHLFLHVKVRDTWLDRPEQFISTNR